MAACAEIHTGELLDFQHDWPEQVLAVARCHDGALFGLTLLRQSQSSASSRSGVGGMGPPEISNGGGTLEA